MKQNLSSTVTFFFNSWKGQLGLQILTFQNGAQIILLPDIKGNM